MSKAGFDISMSLDGFITAGNQSQEELLGEGGQHPHAWMEDAGLFDVKEDGCVRRCHLDTAPLGEVSGCRTRYRVFWKDRFDALADYLRNETNDR